MQDARGDRVEEGLGQLGLLVLHQQADVVQLDLLPHGHGLVAGLELALEPALAFAHAQVVELDALALGALLAVPVAGFKAVLGARRLGAKQRVVAVEAVDHGLRDGARQGGVERGQRHGGYRGRSLEPGLASGARG